MEIRLLCLVPACPFPVAAIYGNIADINDYGVVIVGASNAAFCAAHAAREHGVRVLMLECAPPNENGGNSRFTVGAIRFA